MNANHNRSRCGCDICRPVTIESATLIPVASAEKRIKRLIEMAFAKARSVREFSDGGVEAELEGKLIAMPVVG